MKPAHRGRVPNTEVPADVIAGCDGGEPHGRYVIRWAGEFAESSRATVTTPPCCRIVVGGGHAGVEAALAAARHGRDDAARDRRSRSAAAVICTLAVQSVDRRQREGSARARDRRARRRDGAPDRPHGAARSRFLNESKGPSVRALRAQADKDAYARAAIDALPAQRVRRRARDGRRSDRFEAGSGARRRPAPTARSTAPQRDSRDRDVSRRAHLSWRRQRAGGRLGERPAMGLSRGAASARLSDSGV
jgi:hypothetical protein